MHFSEIAVLVALIPLTVAQTCNLSNATPYVAESSGGSGTNSTGSLQATIDAEFIKCNSGCGLSTTCITGCLNTACKTYCTSQSSSSCQATCLSDPCAAFYGTGSATPDPEALNICYKAAQAGQCNAVGGSGCVKLRARADFECSSDEKCYKEDNGNYFCLNESTGDYVDYEGGRGNVKDDTYTSAVSSNSASPTTTTSARSGSGASTPTTGTGTRATSTSASTTPTAAAAGSSTTPNAAARNIGTGSALGVFGAVVALLL